MKRTSRRRSASVLEDRKKAKRFRGERFNRGKREMAKRFDPAPGKRLLRLRLAVLCVPTALERFNRGKQEMAKRFGLKRAGRRLA